MLHLLFIWNLSNCLSRRSIGTSFRPTVKFLISAGEGQTLYFWFKKIESFTSLCRGEFLSTIIFQWLIILHCLIWSTLDDYFYVDNCLRSVFKLASAAKMRVYELFDQYVYSWLWLISACCYLVIPCISVCIYFTTFFCFFFLFYVYFCLVRIKIFIVTLKMALGRKWNFVKEIQQNYNWCSEA